jgi:choline dehydrogenase
VLVERRRATGVSYLHDGRPATAYADRVIVSAGVYNTPAILQRSGIGPAGLLAPLGIPVVADLPSGIGLLDHPGCAVFFRVDGVSAMTGRLFPVTMRGPAGENGEPPWHIHPFPADQEEGLSGFFAYLCRQEGSGSVEIVSRDPSVAPVIDHDYLAGEREYALFMQAYDEMRRIVATAPFAKRNARLLTEPRDFRHHLEGMLASAHHQSSTCRMGSDPKTSVVDPLLRVHGIEGLLVADTSVFPDTIMHNTNLAAYVVGEKAAEIIRGPRAPA